MSRLHGPEDTSLERAGGIQPASRAFQRLTRYAPHMCALETFQRHMAAMLDRLGQEQRRGGAAIGAARGAVRLGHATYRLPTHGQADGLRPAPLSRLP
jgi:hypothetical protein